MTTLENTPARLRLQARSGMGLALAASLGPLALGGALTVAAISAGPLLLLPFAGILLAVGLIFLVILLTSTPEHDLTFDRPADTLTIRRHGLLRARHERLALSAISGVAVERANRRFSQKDPDTGKRRMVSDIAFRPILLTADARRPLTVTFTNEDTATKPARTALRWLLQDAAAEPPILDQLVDSPAPQA